jgi:hypothetical protein
MPIRVQSCTTRSSVSPSMRGSSPASRDGRSRGALALSGKVARAPAAGALVPCLRRRARS